MKECVVWWTVVDLFERLWYNGKGAKKEWSGNAFEAGILPNPPFREVYLTNFEYTPPSLKSMETVQNCIKSYPEPIMASHPLLDHCTLFSSNFMSRAQHFMLFMSYVNLGICIMKQKIIIKCDSSDYVAFSHVSIVELLCFMADKTCNW